MKKREIGSDFELNLDILNNKDNIFFDKITKKSKNNIFLSTGREALKYILSLSKNINKKILLPAYMCDSILKPIKELNIDFDFFKLNKDLTIDFEDLKSKVSKEITHILVINYFGKRQNLYKLNNIINKKDITIIEDITHTLFNKTNNFNIIDYQFASIRKWFSVPDAGMILSNNSLDKCLDIDSCNKFSFKNLLASVLKYQYLYNNYGDKKYYLKIYREAMKYYSNKKIKPTIITDISKKIIYKVNINLLKRVRKKNYDFLYSSINHNLINYIQPISKKMIESEIPLGLAIICERRDELRKFLIENDIYTPIHWELPDEISKSGFELSHHISNNILTIPCDQRYNIQDMKRIIKTLNQFYYSS